jgi:SAM-dependent methyltransferase
MRLAETYLRRYYAWDTLRQWGGAGRTPPQWFDHRADLYRFSELRTPLWLERGVFSREVMLPGCRVLDLCCGDGFYAYHFYSEVATHIHAIDRDPVAIAHARRWHNHPRISYSVLDVLAEQFPGNRYDVIVWDGALEYFSEPELHSVLGRCVDAMQQPAAVLCGYAIMADRANRPEGRHPAQKHWFGSAQELKQLLLKFFPHVGVIETEYPARHNLYFRAAFDPARLHRFQ